jgi:cytochrome c oxidase subunit 2
MGGRHSAFELRRSSGKAQFAASVALIPGCGKKRLMVSVDRESIDIENGAWLAVDLGLYCQAVRLALRVEIGRSRRRTGGRPMVERAMGRIAKRALAAIGVMALTGPAWSAPQPWEMNLQPAASPIMEMIHRFHDGLLVVVTLIVVFVLALLLYCIVRFNARVHPIPSKTSHNTLIEVAWTIVPILILVGIAVPSFSLLFAEHDPARAIPGFDPAKDKSLTIKATGNQWYWSYDYPDNGDVSFDSVMLKDEERTDPANQPRLLAVDNQLIVPTGIVIRMQVIGAAVIHSFAVPAFGVKIDAIPGRLNETWFRVDREGVYYGQCSELCGRDHAFMPIAVRAVAPDQFNAWVGAAKNDLGAAYKLLAAETPASGTPVAVAGK